MRGGADPRPRARQDVSGLGVRPWAPMFHVQLRRFPHSAQAFNLTAERLHEIVLEPWARGAVLELGDRRWVPSETKLIVLEGPFLDASRLSLGRGWAAALNGGENVTERVLGALQTGVATEGASAAVSALVGEVLQLAGRGPVSLASLWSLTEAQFQGWPASSTLAAAERVAVQLLGAGAVGLYRRAPDGVCEPVPDEQLEPVLRARHSWTATGENTVQLIARVSPVDSGAGADPGAPAG